MKTEALIELLRQHPGKEVHLFVAYVAGERGDERSQAEGKAVQVSAAPDAQGRLQVIIWGAED